MNEEMLTRYLLISGTTRMNVLLDKKMPRGTVVSLKDDDDTERLWTVKERYETLEKRVIKHDWNVGGITGRHT